jgi:hypothetical protein
MPIVSLDHVQVTMPAGGEAASRRFYAGLLGMTEVEKPASLAGRGGCWFEARGAVIHVGVEEAFVPALEAHPAFVVTDLQRCRGELLLAGAPVVADGRP